MRRTLLALFMSVVSVGLFACSQQNTSQNPSEGFSIVGAGASFPFPLYSRWGSEYEDVTSVRLNYQSIGSGAGVKQIRAKTVDFGASDAPLKPAELNEAGLIQFPMIIGGVVVVANLDNIEPGQLKLSSPVLSRIFLGEIANWNDPAIAADNPGVTLPDQEIMVVHRADSSGTSFIFTDYLSGISEPWQTGVGTGKKVNWPVGVGGKGNEGVASYVQKIKGAIGYVEYIYAVENDLPYVQLQNQNNEFVTPSPETFQSAAANADWANSPGYYVMLTNQPGAGSWPITGASFILLHKAQEDRRTAQEMLKFFDWCYTDGADIAQELHYIPMPENVVGMVHETWKSQLRHQGQPVWPVE